jgi:alkanesulfonate monooxygenase SsuD/methylene tetrahydromethanopterin reductase-like flavin-dependent oxidoreductase (luciferase family)
VRNFRLATPAPDPPAKVVLAALGPEMLELAGEIADGVVLNWIGPEAVPRALDHLRAGAARAGRSLDGFEIASFIRVCATDDVEAGRRVLAREITGYAIVDAYATFFRGAGFAPEVDALNAAWAAGDRAGAVRHVSPRVLDALGVVGGEAACRARLAEFAQAGLTMPIVLPLAPEGGDRTGALLRTLRAFP